MTRPAYWGIDFETANSLRGSPCAVALARVEDGQLAGTRRWLIRPSDDVLDGEPLDRYFDQWNVNLHGIGPGDVSDAPTWPEVLAELVAAVGSAPVVGHNASFDLGVVRDACDYEGIDWPDWSYICTLTTGRRVWPALPSYALPVVCDAAGVTLGAHHDPVADAAAAAEILLAALDVTGTSTLDDYLEAVGYRWGRLLPDGGWSGCTRIPPDRIPPDGNGNRYNDEQQLHVEQTAALDDIKGVEVVLTGHVPGRTKAEVHDMIEAAGGAWQPQIRQSTGLLVCGSVPPGVLRDTSTLTRKQEKAVRWGIEMMDARDFLAVLEDTAAPRITGRDQSAAG